MDVQMPEMDGLEATAAIREREKSTGRHVPIVAVTAHAMKGDAERCLAAGMDAYVTKPLQAKELLAVIKGTGRRKAPGRTARGTVDEALLLERVGGDRRALRRLVSLFLSDAPKLMVRIRHAIEAGRCPRAPGRGPRPQGSGLELRRPGGGRGRAPAPAHGRRRRHRRGERDVRPAGEGARTGASGSLPARLGRATITQGRRERQAERGAASNAERPDTASTDIAQVTGD